MAASSVRRFAIFWFTVSPLVVLWDCGFIFLRPRSMPGGDLHLFWKPYGLYIEVDKQYGDMQDPFVIAQSWLNLVEVVLCFATATLFIRYENRKSLLIGFFTSSLTFWKTCLYMLQYTELCSGAHRVAHLSWSKFIFLFLVPNGIWIIFPFLFVVYFGYLILSIMNSAKTKKK